MHLSRPGTATALSEQAGRIQALESEAEVARELVSALRGAADAG